MTERKRTRRITVAKAASRADLDVRVVRRCVEVGVVSEGLTEDDLIDLRRVRRLTSLGVNLPGVEIILRMRRQIEELQAELARLEGVL